MRWWNGVVFLIAKIDTSKIIYTERFHFSNLWLPVLYDRPAGFRPYKASLAVPTIVLLC